MRVTHHPTNLRSAYGLATTPNPSNPPQSPTPAPQEPKDSAFIQAVRPSRNKLKSAAVGALATGALVTTAYVVGQTVHPALGIVASTALSTAGGALLAHETGGDWKAGALKGASFGFYTGVLMNSPEVAPISPVLRAGATIGGVGLMSYLQAN